MGKRGEKVRLSNRFWCFFPCGLIKVVKIMGKNTQLLINLPQLQNLIKKDPASYRDDFIQQYSHFESTLDIFKFSPDQGSKNLEDSVMFVAQVR